MKYVGSKVRMSKYLKDIIENLMKESKLELYVEPFIGGCNVADKITAKKKIAGDSNKYLIGMWKALQNGWVPPERIDYETYCKIRTNMDDYPDELVGIAGFCASFNSAWFGGHYGSGLRIGRDYYKESLNNIKNQLENIKDIEFRCGSYNQFSGIENAFIYCDPPYEATTGYLDDFDNKAFWVWVEEMSKKNIVVVSEYNAPSNFKVIHESSLRVQFNKVGNNVADKVFTINDTPLIRGMVQKWSKDDHLNSELADELDDMI